MEGKSLGVLAAGSGMREIGRDSGWMSSLLGAVGGLGGSCL